MPTNSIHDARHRLRNNLTPGELGIAIATYREWVRIRPRGDVYDPRAAERAQPYREALCRIGDRIDCNYYTLFAALAHEADGLILQPRAGQGVTP